MNRWNLGDTITRVSGRNIRSRQTPIEDVRFITKIAIMFEYFENVGMRVDTAALRRDYPEIDARLSTNGLASMTGTCSARKP